MTSRLTWPIAAAALAICGAAGLASVTLGPDNNWDLPYYHLYAPWAYLHDRYLYDVGPAQAQGFLNPTADFLFYGLVSSKLNEFPRVIAFIMGAVHGINVVLLVAIASHVIRPARPGERWTLRAAAVLMGASGAGFVSLLGVTTNDLVNSIFVLGSLLGVLKAADAASGHDGRFSLASAGLVGGIGIGLKYTAAVFAPGLGLIALVAARRRGSIGGAIAFGAAAAVGFGLTAGHHLLTLWQTFGNPVFPFLNDVFRSPYYELAPIRDMRFVPSDLWALIAYPFYWARTNAYLVSELPFRDWRGAIAYVAIAAVVLMIVIGWLRGRLVGLRASADTRGLGLVMVFVIVSYLCWVIGFAIYRYAVTLEMLTGVVTMGAVVRVLERDRLRIGVAISLLALAAATTFQPGWIRGGYADRYVDVRVPRLPAHSLVLVATWDPVAFFIPFSEPTARYLGIDNNYLEFSQSNLLAAEVKRLMRMPGPPKFILSVGAFDADKLNRELGKFGRRLDRAPCQPIWSNLETDPLSLCPVAPD